MGVVYSKNKHYNGFYVRQGDKGAVYPNIVALNPKEKIVKESWGMPDSIYYENDGKMVWHYKMGMSFAGIVPMIGIGIPLIVPSGSDYVNICFKNGRAVEATESFTGWSGGYYGPKNENFEGMSWNTLGK